MAACRCVGGTKSKGHGESNDDMSNSKVGGLFGSSTMASNKRGLAGGADHESYTPHFQLVVELLMP